MLERSPVPSQSCEPGPLFGGRAIRICKEEGIYTILYGVHNRPDNPRHLPEQFDGFFLETGPGLNYVAEPARVLNRFKGTPQEGMRPSPQHLATFVELEERQIPVYCGDLYFPETEKVVWGEFGLQWGEAVAGIIVGGSTLGNVFQSRLSRRDLLKLPFAAWLLMPRTSQEARNFSTSVGGMDKTGELIKLSHKSHPEFMLLTGALRNAVIAHKEAWLMEQIGNKPHFTTVLGAAHTGIEDEILKDSSERLRFLHLMKPLLDKVVAPETLHTIVRFDFDGAQWNASEMYEVPELKALTT